MSTNTGMVAASTTSPKSPSDAFTTQRSGAWHFPQRGTPCATAGTRFLVCSSNTQRLASWSSPRSRSCRFSFLRRPAPGYDDEFAIHEIDKDLSTLGKITPQKCSANSGLNLPGNETSQRAGAVRGVEPLLGNEPPRRLGDHQCDPALRSRARRSLRSRSTINSISPRSGA